MRYHLFLYYHWFSFNLEKTEIDVWSVSAIDRHCMIIHYISTPRLYRLIEDWQNTSKTNTWRTLRTNVTPVTEVTVQWLVYVGIRKTCMKESNAKSVVKKFVTVLCWNDIKRRYMELYPLTRTNVNIAQCFLWNFKPKKNTLKKVIKMKLPWNSFLLKIN